MRTCTFSRHTAVKPGRIRHCVIGFSCFASLPTRCSPGSWVFSFNGGGESERGTKRGEVSKNKMPPLNHLGGSHVRTVIGKPLIIRKVTALPEHPPPPSVRSPGSERNVGRAARPPRPLAPNHWTEYERLGRSGFGHAEVIRSLCFTPRLRDSVGHRDVACSRRCCCRCISTNASQLSSRHTGLFVMPLTRFSHESLHSLALESWLGTRRGRRLMGKKEGSVQKRADETSKRWESRTEEKREGKQKMKGERRSQIKIVDKM